MSDNRAWNQGLLWQLLTEAELQVGGLFIEAENTLLNLKWCLAFNVLSQQAHYDNMDQDIVQGEEEQGIQEEEGGKREFLSLPRSQAPCALPSMGDFNIHFISRLDSSET